MHFTYSFYEGYIHFAIKRMDMKNISTEVELEWGMYVILVERRIKSYSLLGEVKLWFIPSGSYNCHVDLCRLKFVLLIFQFFRFWSQPVWVGKNG